MNIIPFCGFYLSVIGHDLSYPVLFLGILKFGYAHIWVYSWLGILKFGYTQGLGILGGGMLSGGTLGGGILKFGYTQSGYAR